MPEYIIPYEWTVCGEQKVEAPSLKDAISKVDNTSLCDLESEYADGTFVFRRSMLEALNPELKSEDTEGLGFLEE